MPDRASRSSPYRTRHVLVLSVVLLASGCALGQESAPAESDDDLGMEASTSEVVTPGEWTLPPDVEAIGDQQSVRYDDAPEWDGKGASCSGGLRRGTQLLADFLVAQFPVISEASGYNCRPNTAVPTLMSVHGTGRALDLMLPLDEGDAANAAGDPIANWLVMNAENIGVQYIIWDRASWSPAREGDRTRPYGGPHPHHDHIHVELNEDGGAGITPFIRALKRPPQSVDDGRTAAR